jgi:hypothetical protein
MINLIAKTLVGTHTALSLLGLVWALLLFFQFPDWGWVEPRKEYEQRIASEYDKSVVAIRQAVATRDRVLTTVPPAEKALREAETYYPQNRLYYTAELQRLRKAPDKIVVKTVKGEGLPMLDRKKLGKPVLDTDVAGIEKSYDAYLDDLKKVQGQIDEVQKEIRKYIDDSKEVTFQLTGKDDAGKKVKHGLYDLVDQEYQTQQRLNTEREYLRPQWAEALEDARRFAVRRSNLERTLSRFPKKAQSDNP